MPLGEESGILDVVRSVGLVICFLSGCHLVFQSEQSQLLECGRFATATPQMFGEGLADVRELSVDASGTRGLVSARTGNARGMVPVALVDGVWIVDLAGGGTNLRAREAEFSLTNGRMSPTGEMFAMEFLNEADAYLVRRWTLTQDIWVPHEQVTPPTPMEFTYPGGEVEISAGPFAPDQSFRFVPIVHESLQLERFVAIAQSNPSSVEWNELVDDGRSIASAINEVHDVASGALGIGKSGLVLAYAATSRGEGGGSSLYLTAKQGSLFPPGVRLYDVEAEVGGGDLVEPHLARDCSALYFRRTVSADDAGTIFLAPNMDPPPPSQ